jgi:hypothetical protein
MKSDKAMNRTKIITLTAGARELTVPVQIGGYRKNGNKEREDITF